MKIFTTISKLKSLINLITISTITLALVTTNVFGADEDKKKKRKWGEGYGDKAPMVDQMISRLSDRLELDEDQESKIGSLIKDLLEANKKANADGKAPVQKYYAAKRTELLKQNPDKSKLTQIVKEYFKELEKREMANIDLDLKARTILNEEQYIRFIKEKARLLKVNNNRWKNNNKGNKKNKKNKKKKDAKKPTDNKDEKMNDESMNENMNDSMSDK